MKSFPVSDPRFLRAIENASNGWRETIFFLSLFLSLSLWISPSFCPRRRHVVRTSIDSYNGDEPVNAESK